MDTSGVSANNVDTNSISTNSTSSNGATTNSVTTNSASANTNNTKTVKEYFFKNGDYSFSILNLGCAITSICCPDKHKNIANVVIPFKDAVEDPSIILNTTSYFGLTVGRFANRIKGASFELNGKRYTFAPNDHANLLHSGPNGIWSKIWDVRKEEDGFLCLLKVKSMEDGFPGDLDIRVRFSMSCDGVFRIHYSATCTEDCPLNVTNHSYFNLTGDENANVMGHEVTFNSSKILEVDSNLIPTGSYINVDNTPFDFRKPKTIGKDSNDPALANTHGYDHAFIIDRFGETSVDISNTNISNISNTSKSGNVDNIKENSSLKARGFTKFASVYEPTSGRMMQAFTDLPAFHFYSGNKNGFCLETEFYPNCVNQKEFPSCIIKANTLFESTTAFHFYTIDK